MYEIIADPKDYQIDQLINGTDNANVEMSGDERHKWAQEVSNFSNRLNVFSKKAANIAEVLSGEEKISATTRSLKTFKIQLFKINDAMHQAQDLADRLEADLIKK